MKKLLHLFLAAGVAITPLPGVSRAGCRHVQVVQQAAVVYQPVSQPYYWAVGQQYQEDAQAQRIAAKVLQLLQAAPQVQQQTAACPTCPAPAEPQMLPLTAPDPMSLVAANCAGCHRSNEKAKEHLNMDDLTAFTCEQKLAMIAAVVDGRMPKGKQIDAQTLGDLIGQLSGAETAPK